MHYITQKIHALHYTGNTGNTCTTLHREHMLYITQETHALHYTGNTCSTLHMKYMHYITQETHDLHHSGNTCTTSQNITQYTHYYTVKADISSQDKHIPKIAKLTRKGPKYINTSLEKMN